MVILKTNGHKTSDNFPFVQNIYIYIYIIIIIITTIKYNNNNNNKILQL